MTQPQPIILSKSNNSFASQKTINSSETATFDLDMDLLLLPKEKYFCEEYIRSLNATDAARNAGYPDTKSLPSVAYELLTRPHVRAYVKHLMQLRSQITFVDAFYVVENLKVVLQRCMQAVPVMKFDPVQKRMVQEVEVDEVGNEIGVYTFDSTGANKSLELLGRHTGMFNDKLDMDIKQRVAVVGQVLANVIHSNAPLAIREEDIDGYNE